MLIHVMYPDSNYDYVKEFVLDNLIETRKIAKFLRGSGWVSIGVDPVRSGKQQKLFSGVEKRNAGRALSSRKR